MSPSKLKNLKQQLSSSRTQHNGQAGKQRQNIQTHSRLTNAPYNKTKKIIEKRRLRRSRNRLRTPESKRLLNAVAQELKQLISNKNDSIQPFLQGLTPTESTDYILWKAIKEIKQVKTYSAPFTTTQVTWARTNIEKAQPLLYI
jgi:hypothetical protein